MQKNITILLLILLIILVGLVVFFTQAAQPQSATGVRGIDLPVTQPFVSHIDPQDQWRLSYPSSWQVHEEESFEDGSLKRETEITSSQTHESSTGKIVVALHAHNDSAAESLAFIRSTYEKSPFKGDEAYVSIKRSLRDGHHYYAHTLYIIPADQDFYYVIAAYTSAPTEEALEGYVATVVDMINSFTLPIQESF